MKAPSSTKSNKGKVPGVISALYRDGPKGLDHIGVHDLDDTKGSVERAHAKAFCQ